MELWIFPIFLILSIVGSETGNVPTVRLSSGHRMPVLGFGTANIQKSADGAEETILTALKSNYTFFDTAYVYKNAEQIGNALKKYFDKGGKRADLFISSKLPAFAYKPGDVEKFIKISLNKLKLDYLDLYLIHHSVPIEPDEETGLTLKIENGKAVRASPPDFDRMWKEMEYQVKAGRAKSIGLSNFNEDQFKTIYDNAKIKPSNWQVEIHGYFQQKALRKLAKSLNVTVTAFSPLSSLSSWASKKFQTPLVDNWVIKKIAANHKKTPAQVLLRNLVQDGLVVIPKTVHASRMRENLNIFDFELEPKEMAEISKLDMGDQGRIWTFDAMFGGLVKSELALQGNSTTSSSDNVGQYSKPQINYKHHYTYQSGYYYYPDRGWVFWYPPNYYYPNYYQAQQSTSNYPNANWGNYYRYPMNWAGYYYPKRKSQQSVKYQSTQSYPKHQYPARPKNLAKSNSKYSSIIEDQKIPSGTQYSISNLAS